MKNFFKELKRRNIYKVVVAYAITGWIIMQIATNVFPALEFPQWTTQFVIILVLIGFPIALVFAWAFEITPEGVRRTRDVPEHESISHETGRSLNYWIIGLLSVALLLVLAERIWWAGTYNTFQSNSGKTKTVEQKPSVAVLPFDDYSPNKDQQWFADGLTEELLNSLARIPELKVTAKTSSFYYRDKNLPLHQIADTLNVNHIVEGSVRRFKDNLRVTAQLIRAEDRSHLWSKTYDRHIDSVFAIQKDIAENIASALDVYLDEKERRRMFMFGTRNVKAYDAYLKGMELYWEAHKHKIDLLWEANRLFDKATSLDPEFAAAYYEHHDAFYHRITGLVSPPADTLTKQKAYNYMFSDLNKAIRYADTTGLQFIYRMVRTYYSDDWSSVDQLVQKLKTDQSLQKKFIRSCCGWAYHLLIFSGHAKFAKTLVQRAIKQDPKNKRLRATLANTFMMLGQQDSALYHYNNIRVRNLNASFGKKLFALLRTGNLKKAKALEQRLIPQWPSYVEGFKGKKVAGIDTNSYKMKIEKAVVHFAAGNYDRANQIAREVDRSLLGPQHIMEFVQIMGGIIPFDVESIPNFMNRLEEVGAQTTTDTLAGRPVRRIVQQDN